MANGKLTVADVRAARDRARAHQAQVSAARQRRGGAWLSPSMSVALSALLTEGESMKLWPLVSRIQEWIDSEDCCGGVGGSAARHGRIEIDDVLGNRVAVRTVEEMDAYIERYKSQLIWAPEGVDECLPSAGYVGYVLGARRWTIGPEERLYSPVMGCRWRPGVAIQCARRPDIGIYANKRVPHEAGALSGCGVVALWGDVYEHENGYRASHAYPYALIAPEQQNWRAQTEEAAEKYAVPVVSVTEAMAMVGHGP